MDEKNRESFRENKRGEKLRTSSCKAKGRRACQQVKDAILKAIPLLTDDDINVVPSGVKGPDLWLSPEAQKILKNMVFEIKNKETLNIWQTHKQAEGHCKEEIEIPVVCFKRNHSPLYISMKLDDFFSLFDPKPF